MPPLSLNDEVLSKQADAIQKALRATAILRERHFPAAPSLSGQALEFHKLVNDPESKMYGNQMLASIASVLTGQKVEVNPAKALTPEFLGVMKDKDGLFIYVNSMGGTRRVDGSRTKAKSANATTWDTVPATDVEVEQFVNGLLTARPAHTLKLFFGGSDED